ncbi:hypothetical protein [Sporisorium scitamineum]|uniref:Uncharacterized protein n=1 Tax=Sporisorium scitamineum TaxID=49012 RepID=A0A0F7S1N5_9BASI|nr:hypothetical protein [Sporisorium scitamineum]
MKRAKASLGIPFGKELRASPGPIRGFLLMVPFCRSIGTAG